MRKRQAVVLLGLGYWLLGSPYATLLAVAGAIAWMIPVVGGALATIPPLLLGLLTSTELGITTVLYTWLVLLFLERTIHGGERVLDYGCGSGILAIAAAKLGARQVAAVDIDHRAVQTARANALANAVALTAALPDALTAVDYDVIVANILAQPLIELAPLFARLGARVALSGILETQAAEVRHAYAPRFDMHIAGGDEGWVLLEGVRK